MGSDISFSFSYYLHAPHFYIVRHAASLRVLSNKKGAGVASRTFLNRNLLGRPERLPNFQTTALLEGKKTALSLNVIIQGKLIRHRPQADGVEFIVGLVFDPLLDDVLGEDIALKKEGVVFL